LLPRTARARALNDNIDSMARDAVAQRRGAAASPPRVTYLRLRSRIKRYRYLSANIAYRRFWLTRAAASA
jgi:hypothetical protein